jgi:hypothetical protein
MQKLKTRLLTKVIMKVANVVCKVWWYGRCKLRRDVNDFDYHITDLRNQYPNEVAYKFHIGILPFICKTVEEDTKYEKTVSIKIGDCNIRYSFDRLVRANETKVNELLFLHDEARTTMLTNLLTETKVRHNNPITLKVFNFEREAKDNVVKLHNK